MSGTVLNIKEVFPAAGAELNALYDSAAENGGLTALDFYTLRDLQELSGYTADEPLQVLMLCLFLSLREGSVCLEFSEAALARRMDGLLDRDKAREWAKAVIGAIGGGADKYPELIGSSAGDCKPLIARQIGNKTFFYFQKYLKHERALELALNQRLKRFKAPENLAALRAAAEDVLERNPHRREGKPVELNNEQKTAVGLALLRNFVVISGGPGTGKTSIVVALLRSLIRAGVKCDRIALAAPTGRAAQRMTESIREGLDSLEPEPDSPDAAVKGFKAQTVHRLIGYNPKYGSIVHHRENPLEIDLLVLDEVSMIDMVMMARVLEAVPQAAKLVLLGDKDQLPSVDAGSVFADLTPEDGKPRYCAKLRASLSTLLPGIVLADAGQTQGALEDTAIVLLKNYRSQGHIQEIAARINALCDDDPAACSAVTAALPRINPACGEGAVLRWPSVSELNHLGGPQGGGCWLLEMNDSHRKSWSNVLTAWATRHYLQGEAGGASYKEMAKEADAPSGEMSKGEMEHEGRQNGGQDARAPRQYALLDRLFQCIQGARILTLIREGAWGSQGINAELARILHPQSDTRGRPVLFEGAPVLVTSNNYALQLFNGDVGVALRSREGGLRVVFKREAAAGETTGDDHTYVSFPVESLPGYELAFALTVHKSQGSEYGQILLALPPKGATRLLNKRMIYTAITRAQQLAVICGDKEVLSAAIGRRVERYSGMRLTESDG